MSTFVGDNTPLLGIRVPPARNAMDCDVYRLEHQAAMTTDARVRPRELSLGVDQALHLGNVTDRCEAAQAGDS